MPVLMAAQGQGFPVLLLPLLLLQHHHLMLLAHAVPAELLQGQQGCAAGWFDLHDDQVREL